MALAFFLSSFVTALLPLFPSLSLCSPLFPLSSPSQVKVVGKVVRAIAILSHPLPNTNDSSAAQIIIPQKQIGRKSDM